MTNGIKKDCVVPPKMFLSCSLIYARTVIQTGATFTGNYSNKGAIQAPTKLQTRVWRVGWAIHIDDNELNTS